MFEKTPVQEKSFKGFLKRLALRLKEHPRIFAFVRFFIVTLRKIRRKLNRLVGGFTVRYKISGRRRKREMATTFEKNIKFSVVVPLYNTPIKFLKEMIESVRNQTYSNWQLCLADGSDSEHAYVGEYVNGIADDRICYKK